MRATQKQMPSTTARVRSDIPTCSNAPSWLRCTACTSRGGGGGDDDDYDDGGGGGG